MAPLSLRAIPSLARGLLLSSSGIAPSTLAPLRPCCRPCPLSPVRLLSVLMTPPQPGNLLGPPSYALKSSLGPRSRPAAPPSGLPSQSVFSMGTDGLSFFSWAGSSSSSSFI